MKKSHEYLLAVDVGLNTGLALFARSGHLLWYRSHHLASPGKLKNILTRILATPPQPSRLILEGGGPLTDLWLREAERRNLPFIQLHAEDWREELLYPRQQRNSLVAKRSALVMARQVIEQLGGKRPTSLRHDTAEAILVGYYGLLQLGWLTEHGKEPPGAG